MTPLIKPNFFIVGAAKCGTTALYVYLRDHPRVFLSPVKEPRYFAEDMPNLMNRVAARDDYLRLFKGANDRHIAVGEASPQYLYSAVAPAKIRAFNPDARIIAMLRNPVDMAWAAHAECLYWFVEEEPDFEKAWRLQGERRAGRCVPPLCKQVTMLLGAEVAMLGAQVERLLAVFPRDQVKFVLFEDFCRAHAGSVRGSAGVPGRAFGRPERIPKNQHDQAPPVARLGQVAHSSAETAWRNAEVFGTSAGFLQVMAGVADVKLGSGEACAHEPGVSRGTGGILPRGRRKARPPHRSRSK